MRGKKMKGPASVDAMPAEKMGGRSMPPASGPKVARGIKMKKKGKR